jgi:sec-independent protein translocase protein TatB
LWIGKLQSTIANVKIEIKQQLHAEEMRQIMQQQSIVEDVQQLVAETQQVVNDIKTSSESLSKDLNNHDKPA